MQTIYNLDPEFTDSLNRYRDWVFAPKTQDSLQHKIEWQLAPLKEKNQAHEASSLGHLMAIDHDTHNGYPADQFGLNLNYGFLKDQRRRVDPQFFDEVRDVNNDLDQTLQMALGARFCALKMFYPRDGYIAWHTNWNVPGYNIIFTYSDSGNGHWRHIDSTATKSHRPDPERMVHIDDVKGWHCKVGYFGKKEETDKIVWHSAYTAEPRLTVSYVVFERNIWQNMVDELRGV